jgi:hypothetical protein
MKTILLTALSIILGSALLLAMVWLLAVAIPQVRAVFWFAMFIWMLLAS